jgi:hypothetical protein
MREFEVEQQCKMREAEVEEQTEEVGVFKAGTPCLRLLGRHAYTACLPRRKERP